MILFRTINIGRHDLHVYIHTKNCLLTAPVLASHLSAEDLLPRAESWATRAGQKVASKVDQLMEEIEIRPKNLVHGPYRRCLCL